MWTSDHFGISMYPFNLPLVHVSKVLIASVFSSETKNEPQRDLFFFSDRVHYHLPLQLKPYGLTNRSQEDQNLSAQALALRMILSWRISRSQRVPLLLLRLPLLLLVASFASELLLADCLLEARWRTQDIGCFCASHPCWYPHGVPVRTPHCVTFCQ